MAWGRDVTGDPSAGRTKRSHADRGDLNVPLVLKCEVVGMVRWLERVR
jgi:hypothetical protein